MQTIYILLLVLSLAALIGMLWGNWLSSNFYKTEIASTQKRFTELPVSILKPLKGVDADLEKNLVSFSQIDHLKYELLLSLAKNDPAEALAQKLAAQFPEKIRLFYSESEFEGNPKVHNLRTSYNEATHDLILISDSNTWVEPEFLVKILSDWQKSPEGVLTSAIVGKNSEGLGALLEAIFLNTFYARWMRVADFFGKTCCLGKAMMFKKSTADRFGGMKTLSSYIAEDYVAGEAMRKLGLDVHLSRYPITQSLGRQSISDFWRRHLRWGRIRKAHSPLVFFLEIWSSPLPAAFVGALASSQLDIFPFPVFFLAYLISACCSDMVLSEKLGSDLSPIRFAGGWILRELISFPLWLTTALGSEVNWRGRKLKIEAGGILFSE